VRRLRVILAGPAAPDALASRDVHGATTPPARRPAEPAAVSERAIAIVIDVLRATSSLVVALANGAAGVIAAGTVEEGFALKRRHPDGLLCGERDGRIVPGFDLGNSPTEYEAARVRGRLLLFASTNGSQALRLASSARRRLLGAFVNAAAVVEEAAGAGEVALVAAGKLGRFSLEDAACAGWIARGLAARGFVPDGPAARFALAAAPADDAGVRALLQGCSHGRYLRWLGGSFARDVDLCARLDTVGAAFAV
jgi:2-phosphosulfolactate phosphatase